MTVGRQAEDTYCNECEEEEIYMDVKEEPSVYKVGAYCHGCDWDYGVLKRVQRSEVGHMDEVYEKAEEAVEQFFD